MLMETTNRAFSVGDLVRVISTGQIGKVVAFEDGRWKIEVAGTTSLCESSEIVRRQALFG